ncbi:histidine kinase [Tissierella sp.]|uniref:sensor histidine kinase n=1 Tax=Tissierella sp. TaxID=41274 RepID=UPI002862DD02|nr:ATP-binding protein [Tissierella sp.]MDR7855058.1 histidine kinase [Tissierella sp.]
MLSDIVTNEVSFLGERLEESRILFIYRYISLFITSIFYFMNHSEHLIGKTIFILICLTISAIILSYLYLIYEDSKKNIMILLLIETVGNSILLIPSGGINSPFIWYTLNTILISSIFLKARYFWINLFSYILIISILASFGVNYDLNVLKFIKEESNLILSFIMIIVAVQVWSIFVKKTKEKSIRLEELNKQLESANERIIDSMNHITALYQSVNILSNQGNKEGLIKLLFEHIKKITKTKTLFYYDILEDSNKIIWEGDNDLLEDLKDNITKDLDNMLKCNKPMEICISDTRFVLLTVKSIYGKFGIFGLETMNQKESITYKNNIYQLQFLSELVSIAFERLYLEEINERLLITEEQNRIANDLHDSVLQRLFSMSCGIFALMKNLEKYTTADMEEELNIIRNTTDTVMKELRAKIYGLSWKKSGSNSFTTDIKKYIDDIKKYNNINIPFSIIGSEELLSCKQKKALYRIICEGIGNAVRHGEAKNIEVNLNIKSSDTLLLIVDDGTGFDLVKAMEPNKNGLGMQNLYQLTESLHGEIRIDSSIESGTKIDIRIPNNVMVMKKEELAYENSYS